MIATTDKPLTARQQQILSLIATITADRGYPPSIRDIAAADGSCINAVNGHLRALQKRGLITRDSKTARSIRIVNHAELTVVRRGPAVLLVRGNEIVEVLSGYGAVRLAEALSDAAGKVNHS